jgi:hypothetical protein
MPARLPDIIVGFGLGVGVFALVTLIFSLQTSPLPGGGGLNGPDGGAGVIIHGVPKPAEPEPKRG